MPLVQLSALGTDKDPWPEGLTVGALIRAVFPNGTRYKLMIDESAAPGRRSGSKTAKPKISTAMPPVRLVPLADHEAAAIADELAPPAQSDLDTLLAWMSSIEKRGVRDDLIPAIANQSRVLAKEEWRRRQKLLYGQAPMLPADLFAATGLLLDLSGASHHVLGTMGDTHTAPAGRTRPLRFTTKDRHDAIDAARRWRENWMMPGKGAQNHYAFLIPDEVQTSWSTLLNRYWEEQVFRRLPASPKDWETTSRTRAWWREALFLFVTADEAMRNVGFPGLERSRTNRGGGHNGQAKPRLEQYYDYQLTKGRKASASRRFIAKGRHAHDALYSISTVPSDLACVLPKSRTAQVGCTLRSLSHNAALLPSQGRARAQWWMYPPDEFPLRSEGEALNLLLVPYPFAVPNGSMFSTHLNGDESQQGYGWFKVRSKWADDNHGMSPGRGRGETHKVISRLVENLTKEAAKATGPIHGIVFPELALSFDDFDFLIKRIERDTAEGGVFNTIELFVAGLRSDETGRKGNFAGACVFSRPFRRAPGTAPTRQVLWNVQEKHHRWRLDRRQIKSYDVGPWLSSGLLWWEDIELLSRSLNIFAFRDCSTVAPLICEDLARLEPVHELVRAIGPNLIIALLMDGPQLPERWPGRYALGLAEDPGCSVLTLSSYGLIGRANAIETDSKRISHSVGLWRNDNGDTKQLALEPGTSAIVLSLAGEAVEESTLDGRADNGVAMRWTYVTHKPVSADPKKFPWARSPKR